MRSLAAGLLALTLAVPAAAAQVTFGFTFLVEELDDPAEWTGLLGGEEVSGTFTFDDTTPGTADPGGGTAYEGAITRVEVPLPDLVFAWNPTPFADLNRVFVANDTLIATSGFRDTWVAATIENELTALGETFALGLGDSGTLAIASEALSEVPPDPGAFESTDVVLRFESTDEAWRVAGRVLALAAVPEPPAPLATAGAGALLALAAARSGRGGAR